MPARIYRPSRTAMQSGKAKTRRWVLEFEPEQPREIEPLMGYTSSGDMRQQLTLYFDTSEEAVAYAERKGIPFTLFEPHETRPRVIAYADNFRYNRVDQWSH